MATTSRFDSPNSLNEALNLLSSQDYSMLAGGTDFYPALRDQRPEGNILDVTKIEALRVIERDQEYLRIGAGTTWSDIINADLPSAFDGLKLAAREIGSVQIQNRATLVGNICNASPAADGVPPLLTLDAIIRLSSVNGERDIPLASFITGNRRTVIRSDELVTAILIPRHTISGHSTFLKLGARTYLVISIAMVAARIEINDKNIITSAAISIGACSLVAKRLTILENALIGKPSSFKLLDLLHTHHLDDLSPIDDVRASASYRKEAALELTRRALSKLLEDQ